MHGYFEAAHNIGTRAQIDGVSNNLYMPNKLSRERLRNWCIAAVVQYDNVNARLYLRNEHRYSAGQLAISIPCRYAD